MRYSSSVSLKVLAAFAVAWFAAAPDAAAQSAAQRDQWARDCAQLGGRLNYNTGTCEGANSGSSSGGGGYTAEQEAMLNLAGQFGTLLGQAIRQSFEQSARQAEINRIQREWEAEQARQRAAAAAEERRRRNQALLANMRGAVGTSELTMRGTGSGGGGLQMRTVEDMDRENANRPQTPRPAAETEDAQGVWNTYLAALQARNDAERAHAVAASDLAAANDLVAGIRREIEAQRALVEAAPPGSEERRLAEARLAEMERGLADATRLRDQAEARVGAARAASERAEQAFAAADARRRALGDGATIQTAATSTPSAPEPHTDTSVVDLRGASSTPTLITALPQSLPRLQEVENSPGRERWTQGMQAVIERDWVRAAELFDEARRLDPTNQALINAHSLAEFTRDNSPGATDVARLRRPTEADLDLIFPRAAPAAPGALQTPQDEDLALLFDNAEQSLDDAWVASMMDEIERESARNQAAANSRAMEDALIEGVSRDAALAAAGRREIADNLAAQALARLQNNRDVPGAIALLGHAARQSPETPQYAAARDALVALNQRTTASSSRIEPARSGGPNN